MKFNKKLLLISGATTLLTFSIINTIQNTNLALASNTPTQTEIATSNIEENKYIDTKHKSADGQFLVNIGTFFEYPIYQNNEKVKNILYTNSSTEHITEENIDELKDMCLSSPYKYDEVYIRVKQNYCLKYNPFTNEITHGQLDNNYNFIKD